MRWLIVVAVVMGGAGCVRGTAASLVRWNADERVAAFSVPLCGSCQEPEAYSVDSMRSKASQRCPTGFSVIEEGTRISPDVQAYAFPVVGGGVVAGTQSSSDYYWVVRCSGGTSSAADDLARFDHRFVVVTLRDGSSVAGEVVARTAAGLTLRQVDGSRVDVQRVDVATIKAR